MDWPPQSPDLNIIEAVGDHLDRERNKRQPKSKEELQEVLKKKKTTNKAGGCQINK